MMQDGLFDKFPCDAVFGLHNMPGMPANQLGFRSGPAMASSNRWDFTIRGLGGHAAHPHRAVEPPIVAADLVHALATLTPCRTSPSETACLTLTQRPAGGPCHGIPGPPPPLWFT